MHVSPSTPFKLWRVTQSYWAYTLYRCAETSNKKKRKKVYLWFIDLLNKHTTNAVSYAGCTLSPREPETMRERECRWKHSPRMLSCSLGRLYFVSLPLAFLVVCDVRVKGSRVSPGCRLMSCAKIEGSR